MKVSERTYVIKLTYFRIRAYEVLSHLLQCVTELWWKISYLVRVKKAMFLQVCVAYRAK